MINKSYWLVLSVILFSAFRLLPASQLASSTVDNLIFLKTHVRWEQAEVWIYDTFSMVPAYYPLANRQDKALPDNLASFWYLMTKGDCTAAAEIGDEIAIYERDSVQFLIGNCLYQAGQADEAARVWRQIDHVDRYFLRQILACPETTDEVCEDRYYQLATRSLSHADWSTTWRLVNHFRRSNNIIELRYLLINLQTIEDIPAGIPAYVEAEILWQEGDVAAALNRYERIMDDSPPLFRIYADAGRVAEANGQFNLARTYWLQGLALPPNHPSFYRFIANSYYQQGYLNEAYQWYEEIPDDYQSLIRRADIHFGQERFAEAITLYEQAFIARQNSELLERMVQSYFMLDRPVQAREIIEQAIAQTPKDVLLYLLLATTCNQLEDWGCAHRAYTTVLELEPDNGTAQQGLQSFLDEQHP